ncbi:MAG: GlsB/YeaQ/YmgE family stress response membrane protein [Xanthobacteraceae bacterium]|nr:GlsB/YeaQ/YmgE family stress response membrane protein [Xanthobacteraceae bacterium]QYK44769.1 MAG: GlsB/YeaQ/YmgE family stress response membrane protein [Xanthobacteraceae bacterium]
MSIEGLIILLIIGAVAGWLAGVIMKGFGFGLIGNIIVGIVGAAIASWLFPRLGISLGGGIVGSIIAATIGAVILLFVIGLVRRG